MSVTVTPVTLFTTHVEALRSRIPGILEGDPPSVHEARVATRRIRELLPLTANWFGRQGLDAVYDRFKQVGKSLGRTRDADVHIALLKHFEVRVTHAAELLIMLRQQCERRRIQRLRRLIKRFERFALAQMLNDLAAHARRRHNWTRLPDRAWQPQLRRTLADRAFDTRDSIVRATGVYFPNRTHDVRIAIKKLRYAIEIAHSTGFVDPAEAIGELKKAQDILGDLHDRQILIDELIEAETRPGFTNGQTSAVTQLVEAELNELHGRYLTRRARLLEICQETRRHVVANGTATRSLLVAGVTALSLAAFAVRREQLAAIAGKQ